MKALKTLAHNLIQIASIGLVGDNFEVNGQIAENYILSKHYNLNDHDGGFESALEGLCPEYMLREDVRLNKAIELVENYIVEFMGDATDDRDEGLAYKDVA